MSQFTDREKLVLVHLMWGATDQQIVAHTGLPINAVRTSTKAIIRKMGVHNRTQAAVWALARSFNGFHELGLST